jgi:hypothetical protein
MLALALLQQDLVMVGAGVDVVSLVTGCFLVIVVLGSAAGLREHVERVRVRSRSRAFIARGSR